jgi:ABC-type cobalt transport system substrate-binding protein
MKSVFSKNPEYLLLAAVFILLMVLSFLSQGYYGGADNINHYFLSRYSFTYPKLFLNPWGRPLYTILSSPFAQAGFRGIKVFNVLLGFLSAWLLMKTARELKVSSSWMAIIIVCFSPLYMVMMFTAMTEIVFSFVFILSLYLFFSKRYIAAAIIISFLPFARSEGYFIIPILFLGLVLRRQWKAIPFLGFGFIFFSIIGAYQFRDLLWVVRNNPYPLIHPVYHTPGNFWTFFRQTDITFGAPNLIMLCLGIIMLLLSLIGGNREKRLQAGEILLMFLLPVLGYYLFHSYMFSKGWAGSLGFIRVMAAIIPVISMVTLYGFSLFTMLAGNRKWLRSAFTFLIVAAIIFFNFKLYTFPFPLGEEEQQIKNASEWVKSNFKPVPVVCYNDFNVPYFLDTDPYSSDKSIQLWKAESVKNIPMGSIYIWDSHFGPHECKIPLDTVMQDPYMRLIKLFRPKKSVLTFGDIPYEVYVFRKNPVANEFDNYFLTQTFIDEEDRDYSPVIRQVFDFEKASPDVDSHIINSNAASGKQAFLMDSRTDFSPGFLFHCSDLPGSYGKIRVKARVRVYSETPFADNPASLVISLENKKGAYGYKAFFMENSNFSKGKWNQAFVNADLPAIQSPDDVIKVYVWHRGKTDLIIDDLIIDILAMGKDSR